jgi:hypothetical protein
VQGDEVQEQQKLLVTEFGLLDSQVKGTEGEAEWQGIAARLAGERPSQLQRALSWLCLNPFLAW